MPHWIVVWPTTLPPVKVIVHWTRVVLIVVPVSVIVGFGTVPPEENVHPVPETLTHA